MPIYEYTCETCQHDFEFLVRSAASEAACPACGNANLTRRFSVPAAHGATRADFPISEGPGRGPCGMGGCGLPECGP